MAQELTPTAPSLTSVESDSSPRRVWPRRIGVVVGVVLLAAALAMIWSQRGDVAQAMQSIQHLPLGRLIATCGCILATVAANVMLSGVMFNLLMSRYGRISMWEMQALIASASLLNFVPLRPGLLSRVAYHRAYHGIAMRDSAKVIVQAVCVSSVCAGVLVAAILISLQFTIRVWPLALAPMVVFGIVAAIKGRLQLWAAAALVRYVELLVNAVRYSLAFALIGLPIEIDGALAFACVSTIATMVPFLSNGLGLREWAVGLVLPLLSPYPMALGIMADLVNRTAEIAVILPAGLAGLVHLAKRRRS